LGLLARIARAAPGSATGVGLAAAHPAAFVLAAVALEVSAAAIVHDLPDAGRTLLVNAPVPLPAALVAPLIRPAVALPAPL
jgi:hypothetical protein